MMKRVSVLLLLASVALMSCSRTSETDLMAQAKKALEQKKVAEAERLYRQVVDEFPGSDAAPEALYAIGFIQQNETKSLPQAMATMESIAGAYPESKFAGKGLFMAGYISANQLNNTDKARSLYEKYLARYAQSDSTLIAMVRFELENLGKSAEQILLEMQQKNAAQIAAESQAEEPLEDPEVLKAQKGTRPSPHAPMPAKKGK